MVLLRLKIMKNVVQTLNRCALDQFVFLRPNRTFSDGKDKDSWLHQMNWVLLFFFPSMSSIIETTVMDLGQFDCGIKDRETLLTERRQVNLFSPLISCLCDWLIRRKWLSSIRSSFNSPVLFDRFISLCWLVFKVVILTGYSGCDLQIAHHRLIFLRLCYLKILKLVLAGLILGGLVYWRGNVCSV